MSFAVLIGFCVFLIVLGVIANKRNKKDNIADYFVVSRSCGVLLTAGTFGASFIGAGTFIGTIGTVYAYGWTYNIQLAGAVGGVFVLAVVFAPKFWRFGYYNNGLSMPDLFGTRYHPKWSRTLFAVVILIVYESGIASMFLGINAVWGFISDLPFMSIIIISAVVILIYSMIGGARGVTWTDTLCLSLMVLAALISTIAIVIKNPDLAEFTRSFTAATTPEGQPWLEGDELAALSNSYYNPPMILAWTLIWLLGNFSQPHQVTRTYLARDEKTARTAVSICLFVTVATYFMIWYSSAYARIHYPDLARADYAFPAVIMGMFPSFIAAVLLVAIIAAIFSTCSTMLIICGQCVGYDIYNRVINPNAKQADIIKYSRITMVICSFGAIIIAYFAQTLPTLQFLWSSAFALMGSSIAPSLFCAFYWKGATPAGNIGSMMVGIVVSLTLFGIPELRPFGLHPLLPALILSSLTLIIVSKFTKPASKETLDKFYNPIMKYGEVIAKRKGLID